jgi:high affinity Mn2+ porin
VLLDSGALGIVVQIKHCIKPKKPWLCAAGLALAIGAAAQDAPPVSSPTNGEAWWNFHGANTEVGQLHPSFPAQYSGPNSLHHNAESAETVDLDLYAGLRLWRGAELHVDGLAWQGFGLSHTLGLEAFPNAMAYKVGARIGNVTLARAFIRQTINLGGESQEVADDALHLAGKQDERRVVITVGEMSVVDIFDNNTYAGDPASQFLNWAFVGNEAWDYPANSLGFITGLAGELYEPQWAVRYGFFQMPKEANGLGIDQAYTRAWGMVTELERRFQPGGHPGAVRVEAYLNSARMGSYEEAVDSPVRPANILMTQDYRYKYGFCLNAEQEIFKDVGLFTRLGWSDGHNQAWVYSDVDDSFSMGTSIKGGLWERPEDTFGLAGVVSAITRTHQQFFEDGGTGILAGDGALNYGMEKALETYYNIHVWKTLRVTADYQYFIDPAFNRARGPASVIGGRIHWDF